MGGVFSKPKIPGPSADEIKAQADARTAQAEEKALLTEQKLTEKMPKWELKKPH